MPELLPGTRIEGEDLVGSGDVHDALGDYRHGFEAIVTHVLAVIGRIGKELVPEGDGEGPLEG